MYFLKLISLATKHLLVSLQFLANAILISFMHLLSQLICSFLLFRHLLLKPLLAPFGRFGVCRIQRKSGSSTKSSAGFSRLSGVKSDLSDGRLKNPGRTHHCF